MRNTDMNIMARLPGIAGSLNLMNRHRVLAMTAPYPYELAEAHGGTLPADAIVRLGRENRVGAWTGAGALCGERRVVAVAQKIVRQLLAPAADRLLFMTERCYRALFDDGIVLGFVPYRFGPQSMQRVAGSASAFWDLAGQLKSAIGPVGILGPGRYAPMPHHACPIPHSS